MKHADNTLRKLDAVFTSLDREFIFTRGFAKSVGFMEAIIFQEFLSTIDSPVNYDDTSCIMNKFGKKWFVATDEELHEIFSFFTLEEIRKTINSLKKMELLTDMPVCRQIGNEEFTSTAYTIPFDVKKVREDYLKNIIEKHKGEVNEIS